MESVYDLYQRGCDLLDHGDHQAAIVPLSKARDLEPDKASIREALGRALFHAQRYEGAAAEFHAVASRTPTNDYALFCLGRAMQLLGRHREACKPLALACSLQARTGRLPAVPRSRSPRRRASLSAAMRPRPDAMLDRQLSCRSAGSGSSTESGRTPAFFT